MMFSVLRKRLPTPEEWAKKNADITTPDRIIAEAIATSLREHFGDWSSSGKFERAFESHKHYFKSSDAPRLANSKKKVAVQFNRRLTIRNNFMRYNNHMAVPCFRGTTVNGVEIEPRSAEIIWNAYFKAKKLYEGVEAVNSFALQDTKRNEMAWDLVENLLGLRRNDQGALIPVVDANGRKTK